MSWSTALVAAVAIVCVTVVLLTLCGIKIERRKDDELNLADYPIRKPEPKFKEGNQK